MNTKYFIIILLLLEFIIIQCSSSTNPDNNSNATEGEITVAGDYQTSFNYVMGVYDGNTGEYYGAIATQSLNFLDDEYGFGLYSDEHAVFTKSIGELQWLGYTGMNLDASFDVSDTCKPKLIVNHIVLYYDSSYKSFEPWEFNPENLDSTKSVTINGEMSTDYRKLGFCGK
jgi:hypothetical protein